MFRIRFNDTDTFRICLQKNEDFKVCFGEVIKIASVDYYEGPYEVTPKAHEEQILPTNNKAMSDDVTVHMVPYYETSNLFDGKTAYIASEV